ncbi:YbaB/EbfC family nucleoid-associated protein, partial [Desulfovibrio desulfuricans]|nr:YbaB/EbfC family nucleoid-associated protein [Desulfovibrio desulfuricans]
GLLKQAQKMQKELTKLEDQLNEKVYESTMGGGVIKAEVKGNMSVESITIEESLLEKDNKEDLEEMLKAALNDAFAKAVED